MKFLLQRFSDNRDSTLGLFFELKDGAAFFQAYTLEDQFQTSKVAHETRIPAGLYELKIRDVVTKLTKKYRDKFSWFKFHIEITNVPGFQAVYLHLGNDDEDTDGCVLLGDNADNNRIGYGSISNSTQAYKRFYSTVYDVLLSGKEKVFLEIRDEKELL